MSNLYITADQVGGWSGGSQVTFNESQALASLGPCEVWGREQLERGRNVLSPFEVQDPWFWDNYARHLVCENTLSKNYHGQLKLAHFYAGTFSETIQELRDLGVKISYTAAAHDVEASRREHEKLGIPYPYPHITEPDLWKRYVQGYLEADVLICPSRHSAKVMQGFGFNGRIEIIPHGVDLPKCKRCNGEKGYYEYEDPDLDKKDYFIDCPEEGCWTHEGSTGLAPITPLPERFTVGYLGAIGPDKGLRYLIEAWGKLAYKDAVLVIAGRDSTHPFVSQMIHQWGGNANFNLLGWVEDVSTFYNCLSLYVQPSVTEGFGIEVLEAMAHGRPVVCSEGAGACDLLKHRYYAPDAYLFKAGDAEALAEKIDWAKNNANLQTLGIDNRNYAENFTWSAIREKYMNLWKELLK